MGIKIFSIGIMTFMASCAPQCMPAPDGAPPIPDAPGVEIEQPLTEAPAVDCNNKIQWAGRTPVQVVHVGYESAQGYLDRGNAVDIGYDGHAHVAGHYSSHGAIFHSAAGLGSGDVINYDCVSYTVYGRGSAKAGEWFTYRSGLTVQYSGCGSLCLVFAR